MGSCLGDPKHTLKRSNIVQFGDYRISINEKISEGAYGQIWKCNDKNSGHIYAAKQIRLQNQQLVQMYQKEVKCLKKLVQSRRVIKLINNTQISTKEGNYKIGVILTQFYEMNLLDILKNKKFTPPQILVLLRQIAIGLSQIHTNKCIHLDIKLQNILIDSNEQLEGKYKICDFGSSIDGPINVKSLSKVQKSKLKQYIEANSTMIYRAPQLVDVEGINTQTIDEKTDIWMLGCVAYLLLYRKHPFQGAGPLAIMTGCDQYPQCNQFMENYQREYRLLIDLIKQMLKTSNKQRITDKQLCQKLNSLQY